MVYYFWYAKRLKFSDMFPRSNEASGIVTGDSREAAYANARQDARVSLGNANEFVITQFNPI